MPTKEEIKIIRLIQSVLNLRGRCYLTTDWGNSILIQDDIVGIRWHDLEGGYRRHEFFELDSVKYLIDFLNGYKCAIKGVR